MHRTLRAVLIAFLVTSVYLWLRADPTVFYYGNVLAHVVGGVLLLLYLLVRGPLLLRTLGGVGRAAWLLLALGGLAGCVLIVTGNLRPMKPLLVSHEVLAAAGAVGLLMAARHGAGARRMGGELVMAMACVAVLLGGAALREDRTFVIENPAAPVSMDDESMGGRAGAFFPSSIHTSTGGRIPSDFFMTSETCGRSGCHPDSYREWQSSMHRFSSFNNQFYRKSIEYMQDVVGVEPSKWCAGCHDVAVLLNGMFEKPIGEIVHSPEATVGLACLSCHAMVKVRSTMGNGDYEIEYPPLHDLAASSNAVLAGMHDFLVRMDPEPHRTTFLKPFHEKQRAEFCSTCHKVHLDVPVNNYRWFRGFDEYDAWQASGVSHQGARSFYAPETPKDCVDCHMGLRETSEMGNVDGMGHSHRFAAANTAVPTANQDAAQIQAVLDFIQPRAVTVDIFAASLSQAADGQAAGAELPATGAMNFFGAGEEVAGPGPGGSLGATDFGAMMAPLDRVSGPVLPRGGTARLDVVVRTTGMGHFFPGGTVDSFDVWVELEGVDGAGRTIFWSGAVEDEGRGPVEKSAHFYRALLIDAAGNAIDKRNAWSARALVYARLIPPGAADVAHYRVRVPADAVSPVTFTAHVNYRKFSHFYTKFAYAMQRDPSDTTPDKTPHYDNGRFVETAVAADVAGKVKAVPELPIMKLAESSVTLAIGDREELRPTIVKRPEDKIRWNDFGIGLYLQRDLRGASEAWARVTEIEPGYADGWVNRARAASDEGDLGAAGGYLEKAFTIDPDLAKAHYLAAVVAKTQGDYPAALDHLRSALERFPRDRVVRNEAGRVLFLLRRYEEAVAELEQSLAIDPENLQAHYNLMLCRKALGQDEEARREEQLYMRFKADDTSQSLTGDYLRSHPEDNNERQRIHEHDSIPLAGEGDVADADGASAPGLPVRG